MREWDGLRDVVVCAECEGTGLDLGLKECPADGAVLGEIPMTWGEFKDSRPFGAHR